MSFKLDEDTQKSSNCPVIFVVKIIRWYFYAGQLLNGFWRKLKGILMRTFEMLSLKIQLSWFPKLIFLKESHINWPTFWSQLVNIFCAITEIFRLNFNKTERHSFLLLKRMQKVATKEKKTDTKWDVLLTRLPLCYFTCNRKQSLLTLKKSISRLPLQKAKKKSPMTGSINESIHSITHGMMGVPSLTCKERLNNISPH